MAVRLILDIRWLAGFFDGEGCVSIYRRRNRREHYLNVSISQKDRAPLDLIYEIYGGSIRKTKTPSNCHQWRVSSRKAEMFLRDILPHSIVKKRAIEGAIEFIGTVGEAGQRLPEGTWELREEIRSRVNSRYGGD